MDYNKNGLQAEQLVIDLFCYEGHKLTKSDFEDDFKDDIDAYHHSLGAVSIKSQSDKYVNIALETKQLNSEDHDDYISGWFGKGKADTYIWAIRDDSKDGFVHTLHVIKKAELIKYVDSLNIEDTYSTHAMKNNPNRKYNLPVVKLVKVQDLIDKGYVTKTLKRKAK